MSTPSPPDQPPQLIVVPEPDGGAPPEGEAAASTETISQPAKIMRIGAMTRQLLEEVRRAPLDEASRSQLRTVYQTSLRELGEILSPDLREELEQLTCPFLGEDEAPSEPEIRIAQAQLVGWLEGLFQGIQATLFAQQVAARSQLDQMRRGLPPGAGPGADDSQRPGNYL